MGKKENDFRLERAIKMWICPKDSIDVKCSSSENGVICAIVDSLENIQFSRTQKKKNCNDSAATFDNIMLI